MRRLKRVRLLARSFRIQLSNSQVLKIDKLLRSRGGKSRPSFCCVSPKCSQKRERSAVKGAYVSTACFAKHAPAWRSRSALRRSTAAFSIPGAPLPFGPASSFRRWREGVRDIDPGPHNGPGGCPPGTPGSRLANLRAGAAPHSRSGSPIERPSGEWGCVQDSATQISVKINFILGNI